MHDRHGSLYKLWCLGCVSCMIQSLHWSRKDFMFIRKLGTGHYGEIFLMQTKVGFWLLHFCWQAISNVSWWNNWISVISRLGWMVYRWLWRPSRVTAQRIGRPSSGRSTWWRLSTILTLSPSLASVRSHLETGWLHLWWSWSTWHLVTYSTCSLPTGIVGVSHSQLPLHILTSLGSINAILTEQGKLTVTQV